jgi:two-component system sensor histidine kinase KdpD
VTDVKPGRLDTKGTYQRTLLGILATLAGLGVLLAILLPFRDHLSVALPALVFVLPALAGTVIGGFLPGAIGVVAGFLAYDFFFLPPYDTLTVRSPQNWIALVVYVAVVLVLAQVVSQLQRARADALRREEESGRLYELSQALIGDLTLSQLRTHIVESVQDVFAPRWTALVLPAPTTRAPARAPVPMPGETLEVAATAGLPLSTEDVASVTAGGGHAVSLGLEAGAEPHRVSVALVVSHRPVGMLVLHDVGLAERDRSLLGTFANQAALALDRAQLREQALRARLLEEVDLWRRALMGAASHDLRTPLASIKTAVSSLRRPDADARLAPGDRAELLELIELQADRLARLVTNLLDLTRIESGALELRPTAITFDELVEEARALLGGLIVPDRFVTEAPDDLPLLHIDHVLMSQVLANLLENAARLAPDGSVVHVTARLADGAASDGSPVAEIAVRDEGPGIAPEDRARVFEMFSQNGGGGRAGLGLAIAKAFVEAHGGRIWIDPGVPRGARVVFTVPCEADVPAATAEPAGTTRSTPAPA